MKRAWLARLALVPTLALLLAGCTEKPIPESSTPESSAPTGTTSATGTYKGQNITLSLVKKTDRLAGEGYLYFANGYVTFWDTTEFMDSDMAENEYTCMDTTGKVLYTIPCYKLLSVNKEGFAYGEEMDGSYFRVNLQGEKAPVSDEEYMQAEEEATSALPWRQPKNYGTLEEATDDKGEACYRLALPDGTPGGQYPADEGDVMLLSPHLVAVDEFADLLYLYDTAGEMIHRSGFEEIGHFYEGVAPFWRNGKMGLIGDDGTIIIPATFSVPTDDLDTTPLNGEFLAVQNALDSTLSIYKVTRE